MDTSIREQGSTTQAAGRLSGGRELLANLINWLRSLISLTEEELKDAGIYLGRPEGEYISLSREYAKEINKPQSSGHY